MRIGFSTDEAAGEVNLFVDAEGRDFLVECLNALEPYENDDSYEHFHLFSEFWGGYSLDELDLQKLNLLGSSKGNHLKVTMCSSEKGLVWKNDEID